MPPMIRRTTSKLTLHAPTGWRLPCPRPPTAARYRVQGERGAADGAPRCYHPSQHPINSPAYRSPPPSNPDVRPRPIALYSRGPTRATENTHALPTRFAIPRWIVRHSVAPSRGCYSQAAHRNPNPGLAICAPENANRLTEFRVWCRLVAMEQCPAHSPGY
jgi:hypothetical protein